MRAHSPICVCSRKLPYLCMYDRTGDCGHFSIIFPAPAASGKPRSPPTIPCISRATSPLSHFLSCVYPSPHQSLLFHASTSSPFGVHHNVHHCAHVRSSPQVSIFFSTFRVSLCLHHCARAAVLNFPSASKLRVALFVVVPELSSSFPPFLFAIHPPSRLLLRVSRPRVEPPFTPLPPPGSHASSFRSSFLPRVVPITRMDRRRINTVPSS